MPKALLPIALATTMLVAGCAVDASDCSSGAPVTGGNNGGTTNPPSTTYGGHKLATECDGLCATRFALSRFELPEKMRGSGAIEVMVAQKRFDVGSFGSWEDRKGDYHNSGFSITSLGTTVSYGIDLNGNGKKDQMPCYSAVDRARGEEAALSF